MDTTSKNILIFLAVIVLFYLLSVLSSLILPLVLALLFAALFQPLIEYLGAKKIPSWLVLPIISVLTLLILFGLTNIFISTINDITAQKNYLADRLMFRLESLLNGVAGLTGRKIDTTNLENWLKELYKSGWVTQTAGSIAQGISSFAGSFVMFALYYIFLLSGMTNYKKYIKYVSGSGKSSKFAETIEKIRKSVNSYMLLKTMTSIGTALFVTLICLLFGVKFAFFFGLLAFLFNFIPTFGSIFAVVLPLLMGIIQFDSWNKILFLFAALEVTQFAIGNFIEPKIMGNSLRLNTVTVLFGLVFWGYMWGIAGMMLSVPLMVIIKISLEYSQSLTIFARIMGYPEE